MRGEKISRTARAVIWLLPAALLPAVWAQRGISARQALVQFTLPIEVVPAADGAGSSYTYPTTTAISLPAALAEQIAAHGAGGRVWLGPKNWSAAAAIGADGSMDVMLRPNSQSARRGGPAQFHLQGGAGAPAGPYIEYTNSGGCTGCGIESAAIFFPGAKKYLDGLLQPPAPAGMTIRTRKLNVVRFTEPAVSGMPVLGVAYWGGPPDHYFAEARFVLPRAQAALEQFLEDHYALSCGKLPTNNGLAGC